jgi:hypothetical protein
LEKLFCDFFLYCRSWISRRKESFQVQSVIPLKGKKLNYRLVTYYSGLSLRGDISSYFFSFYLLLTATVFSLFYNLYSFCQSAFQNTIVLNIIIITNIKSANKHNTFQWKKIKFHHMISNLRSFCQSAFQNWVYSP